MSFNCDPDALHIDTPHELAYDFLCKPFLKKINHHKPYICVFFLNFI